MSVCEYTLDGSINISGLDGLSIYNIAFNSLGNIAVLSTYEDSYIYILDKVSDIWVTRADKILLSNISSLAISNDGTVITAGNAGFNSNRGRVYVYKYSGGSWSLRANLDPTYAVLNNSYFGSTLSAINEDGSVIVAGSSSIRTTAYPDFYGDVFTYVWNGSTYTGTPLTTNYSFYNAFGNALWMNSDNSLLLVARSSTVISESGIGSNYISLYDRVSGNWVLRYSISTPWLDVSAVTLNSTSTTLAYLTYAYEDPVDYYGTISFCEIELTGYTNYDQKIIAVDLDTWFNRPVSFDAEANLYVLSDTVLKFTCGATEFWTEEDQCVEVTYEY
jgi:hypothetical protein